MSALHFERSEYDRRIALTRRAMVARCPRRGFEDATALVNWHRAVKSEAELEYMRIAARRVERAARTRDQALTGPP